MIDTDSDEIIDVLEDDDRPEDYYTQVPTAVQDLIPVIGMNAFTLYVTLRRYTSKGRRVAWPSHATLCQRLDVSRSTLIRMLNTLKDIGLIEVIPRYVKGSQTSNLYRMKRGADVLAHHLKQHPEYQAVLDSLND